MPENVPITIIWGSEHNSAFKTDLRLALGGPTEEISEIGENSEKLKNRPISTSIGPRCLKIITIIRGSITLKT